MTVWPDDAAASRISWSVLMRGPQPPTVLLCANGYVLAIAAEDAVALGLEIPGDVDLAGMDDAGPFDVLPLTAASISPPSREMGRSAMRLLHRRITEPAADQASELVVRPVRAQTRESSVGHLRVVGRTGLSRDEEPSEESRTR